MHYSVTWDALFQPSVSVILMPLIIGKAYKSFSLIKSFTFFAGEEYFISVLNENYKMAY